MVYLLWRCLYYAANTVSQYSGVFLVHHFITSSNEFINSCILICVNFASGALHPSFRHRQVAPHLTIIHCDDSSPIPRNKSQGTSV